MKYRNYKTVEGKKRDFFGLSKIAGNRKPISNENYYFLLGRLYEAKTDFIRSPKTRKVYTIGGSENNRAIFEIKRGTIL